MSNKIDKEVYEEIFKVLLKITSFVKYCHPHLENGEAYLCIVFEPFPISSDKATSTSKDLLKDIIERISSPCFFIESDHDNEVIFRLL